jgi:hypothetical protein
VLLVRVLGEEMIIRGLGCAWLLALLVCVVLDMEKRCCQGVRFALVNCESVL